jgi:hypothetical protein
MFIAYSHMFPMILAQVPHVFLKAVPHRTSNYLISFAQNSSFLTYISKPRRGTPSSNKNCYFGQPPKCFLFLFLFYFILLMMGQSKWHVEKI